MTTVIEYAEQQLASTGWAAINPNVAMRLRPSLWGNNGMNARYEFGQDRHRAERLQTTFPGVSLFQAEIEGLGIVPVLSRSDVFLAERIQWVTGGKVSIVSVEAEKAAHQVAPAAPAAVDPLANADVATKEPARSCKDCDNLTVGYACAAARRGEITGAPLDYRPQVSAPRRCIGYAPKYDSLDGRTGRELWPELAVAAEQQEAKVEVEGGNAIDKAGALLAELLKGGPRNAAEILAAAEGASIGERTMQRAADAFGVAPAEVRNARSRSGLRDRSTQYLISCGRNAPWSSFHP